MQSGRFCNKSLSSSRCSKMDLNRHFLHLGVGIGPLPWTGCYYLGTFGGHRYIWGHVSIFGGIGTFLGTLHTSEVCWHVQECVSTSGGYWDIWRTVGTLKEAVSPSGDHQYVQVS